MFFILNIKKLRLPAVLALLFLILAAIIIGRHMQIRAAFETISHAGSAPLYVLVIDAGHGGADGGAVSDNGITESTVNIAIAQKLEALTRFFGIASVVTRSGEDIAYPDSAVTISDKKVWDQKSRVELINSLENPLLISIHQNKFPDSRPHGAQVLYAATTGSAELGKLTHANLLAYIDPENRRVASPVSDKIFLMRSVKCPAILIECGFLSNPEEALLLTNDGYQKKLSAIIAASYLQYTA